MELEAGEVRLGWDAWWLDAEPPRKHALDLSFA